MYAMTYPATQEVPDEVIPPTALDKDACPKCGRIVRQGRVMHVKFCKGK